MAELTSTRFALAEREFCPPPPAPLPKPVARQNCGHDKCAEVFGDIEGPHPTSKIDARELCYGVHDVWGCVMKDPARPHIGWDCNHYMCGGNHARLWSGWTDAQAWFREHIGDVSAMFPSNPDSED